MSNKLFMIYGANGYTGELIAREAKKRGLNPILAGRNEAKVRSLAHELGLEYRTFSLDDAETAVDELNDIHTVIHCAGPFSSTAEPMIEACLQSKTHYTDITGEISVFEYGQSQNSRAKKAGIVVCPGVGFDVIPTDCVANKLKQVMPDATHLVLGFDSRSGFSPGTAKTSVEGLKAGGRIRENGKLTTVSLAAKSRQIDFGDGVKNAVCIPWGDVSTAAFTTGIANIEVYIPMSPKSVKNMNRLNIIRPILGVKLVQNFLKKKAAGSVKGPDERTREKLITHVWGEAKNAKGEIKTARIKTANGYSLTVTGALAVTDYLLTQDCTGGYYTPSTLINSELVEQLPGSGKILIS